MTEELKFKVGDRVRVTDMYTSHRLIQGKVGQVVAIGKVFPYVVNIEGNVIAFHERELELVEEEKTFATTDPYSISSLIELKIKVLNMRANDKYFDHGLKKEILADINKALYND